MKRRELLSLTAKTVALAGAVSACSSSVALPAGPAAVKGETLRTVETRFSRDMGIAHPFICAGMAFICDKSDFCIAVNKAGGVGALSGSLLSPDALRQTIREVKAASDGPFHVNILPVFPHEAQLAVCMEEKVPAVSFHFGIPDAEMTKRLQSAGIAVWVQVGSVADALKAKSVGADAIIAQGGEAGGHTYDAIPMLSLLTLIRDAIGDTPVFAAGGIADGRTAAAALVAGADAIWVGTYMIATPEANAHSTYKQALLKASGEDTIVTNIYGPEAPHFNPMRIIKNDVTKEWYGRVKEIPINRSAMKTIGTTPFAGQIKMVKPFDSLVLVPETTGDLSQMPMLSGQGVGLIKKIKPTGQAIAEMMESAAMVLENVA